jgi:hypothetical protein
MTPLECFLIGMVIGYWLSLFGFKLARKRIAEKLNPTIPTPPISSTGSKVIKWEIPETPERQAEKIIYDQINENPKK